MTPSQENKTRAVKVQMAKYEAVPTTENYNRKGWIEFGKDNLYPNYLIDLYDSCPVHGALSTSIIEMISGKGLEGDQALIDSLDLNDILSDTAFDLKLQGGYYWEIIWTIDRTEIAEIRQLEFENTRIAFVEDDLGNQIYIGVWYSKDWSKISKKCNTPRFIPKLDGLKKDDEPTQVYRRFGKTTKSRVYPKPDYDKSLTWIITEKQIGIFHMNNLLNGLMPQFMIHFNNGQPDPEEARAIKKNLESQMGAENAGGFVVTFNDSGKESPKIDLFPISDADKQYQFLSDKATEMVMIGHRVTTPLLFGIRSNGGLGSNKDEMQTGFEIFHSQVIEPFQRDITEGLSDVFLEAGIDTTFTIIANSPVELDNENAMNAAATALNGAQIESLVNVILQVSAGVLPVESGKAIVKAGFPSLKKRQIEDIFGSIVPGTLNPEEVVQSAQKLILAAQKKKPELTKEAEVLWTEFLSDLGETTNPDWIEIDSWEVDYKEEDADEVKMAVSTGSARPNSQSEQDKTIDGVLYITRYRYSGGIQDHTRPFCRKMIEAAKLYRKEDVMAMKEKAVNPGWGPRGADTYSVWLYKGGGNCHHVWEKVVYVSAKDLGIDVNSPKAKEIAVSKASAAGYKTRNTPKVAQRPIDMPNQGFLPKE